MKEVKIAAPEGQDSTAAEEQKLSSQEVRNSDMRNISIAIVALLVIFAVVVGGFRLFTNVNTGSLSEIDRVDLLHDQNIKGNLDPELGYMYNDYSFVQEGGLWWTEILLVKENGEELLKVPLHNGPREVEDVEISGLLDQGFNQGGEVYVSIDPTVVNKFYTQALGEFTFNLARGIERKPVASCQTEDPSCEGYPTISCEANPDLAVVEFRVNEEVDSSVTLDGSCIIIEGTDEGLVRAVDRLLLSWYSIMLLN